MIKLTSENYKAPTPWKVRRVADSILAALGTGGIAAIAASYPLAGAVLVGVGIVSKFVSNYCDEKPPK